MLRRRSSPVLHLGHGVVPETLAAHPPKRLLVRVVPPWNQYDFDDPGVGDWDLDVADLVLEDVIDFVVLD